jgi:hypothetical protein
MNRIQPKNNNQLQMQKGSENNDVSGISHLKQLSKLGVHLRQISNVTGNTG